MMLLWRDIAPRSNLKLEDRLSSTNRFCPFSTRSHTYRHTCKPSLTVIMTPLLRTSTPLVCNASEFIHVYRLLT